MFRAPLCPSSGAHYDSVWLPVRPSGSRVAAGWRLSAGRMDECPDRRMLHDKNRVTVSGPKDVTRQVSCYSVRTEGCYTTSIVLQCPDRSMLHDKNRVTVSEPKAVT